MVVTVVTLQGSLVGLHQMVPSVPERILSKLLASMNGNETQLPRDSKFHQFP